MSVLPDHKIHEFCQPTRQEPINPDIYPSQLRTANQVPMIEPYNEEQLQPASYDVRLGKEFLIFQRAHGTEINLRNPDDITKRIVLDDDESFVLHPGEFALGVTEEVVHIPNGVVARIEGKSSVGRLGLMVHVTAGFIDPGFNGPITLEMAGLHPYAIRMWPGDLIAQLAFEMMQSPAKKPYEGRYQNAKGVQSSRYGIEEDTKPTKDEYGRVIRQDGTVVGPTRINPDDGNAYVFASVNSGDIDTLIVTDILGGHEMTVDYEAWKMWREVSK